MNCACGNPKSTRDAERCRFCYRLEARRRSEKAFWSHIDKSGGPDACWLWRGATTRNGYGRYSAKAFGMHLAHRIAWLLTHGALDRALDVCHRCDNRPCCNPAHLFQGTRAENMQDAKGKGRLWLQQRPWEALKGERIGSSKLTREQVIQIRERVAAGEQKVALAREFGVTDTAIRLIETGKNWKHLHPVFDVRPAQ